MKELISFRGKREKHFLNDDGTISARIYNDDVHYLKNGKWAEIDNTLVDKGTYYQNKSNEFQTIFTKESDDLVNVKKGNNYLKISCINYKNLNLKKIKERVEYKNNFGQVDFIYKIVNNRIKESIVLNCRDTVPSFFEFVVDTNLDLKLTNEQKIIAINNEETVFTIDTPFMIDALNNINYNLEYVLEKNDNNYRLKLLLDEEWLKRETTKFPVMIDPTIINGTGENVYSTYISTEDSDYNYSNRWYHHIGSDSSGVHRMLMKFELPKIGTGCSIVSATAYLTAQENLFIHFFPSHKAINVHNINANWDEKTATWNNMNDKFDSLIETWFQAVGYNQYAPGEDVISEIDLTSIVKKWYSGTPNYGVMLKLNDESIEDPEMVSYSCRSKAYDLYYETAYRPYLVITYLYQNGVLSYMDYNDVITSSGKISINNFNGNVTNQIVLNKIINAKFPFELSIINNNCDVILNSLNNLSYGWKLNFYETITEDKDNNALIYNDYTSAIHYFYKNEDGNYIDEEGLNLEIKFENSNLVLSDDEGNKKIFSLISDSYKLIKIINLSQDEINISYESEKITSIYNDSKKININYSSSEIKVTSELYIMPVYPIDYKKYQSVG